MNTNIQSVIDALQCFKSNQHKCLPCEYNPHSEMPWPYGCIAGQINIIDDAVALLKAQKADIDALSVKYSDLLNGKLELPEQEEPRLLSRMELASWSEALWLEIRAWPEPIFMPDAITAVDIEDENADNGRFIFISGHIQMLKLLGTQWRCWTKRTTQEQREALLWLPLL